MISINDYYATLFDQGEALCFAWKTNDTSVTRLENWQNQRSPYISVNPLYLGLDKEPEKSSLPYARSTLGRRADCNVPVYRNILIEMDEVPLDKQRGIISEYNMPFSTATYSGGKSIHFVISMSDPCATKEEYDMIVDLIFRTMEVSIDKACRNPSRLTRNPGVMREGKEQKLLEIRGRVQKQAIIEWAAGFGNIPVPKAPFKKQKGNTKNGFRSMPPRWIMDFLSSGVEDGNRNNTAFKVGCGLAKMGYTESEISDMIRSVPNLINNAKEQAEIRATIRSACARKN